MEKLNLLRLYNLATAYGNKPSDLFHLETEIGRWALDEACLKIGRRVENNVNNGKEPFEGFSHQSSASGKKFRSAKALVRKKVKIKSNGTW
jgi:hypothetical protein